MSFIGYARVSSADQDLAIQMDALRGAGCDEIFAEKHTASTTKGRGELDKALAALRPGDTLLVHRLDRLTRSLHDLTSIMRVLVERHCNFRCTEQGGLELNTLTGQLMLHILGAVAEFDLGLKRERQREGIAQARARGAYVRPIDEVAAAECKRLRRKGMGAVAIAAQTKLKVRQVYRFTPGMWR